MLFVRYLVNAHKVKFVKRFVMEGLKQNAEAARQTITQLKNELNLMTNEYNKILETTLRQENEMLQRAVEEARLKLVQLEVAHGVPQIPVPNQNIVKAMKTTEPVKTEPTGTQPELISNEAKKEPKPKKEKKPKEPAAPEAPVDIGRLDLRVAVIEDVQKHPDADSLYVLKINCGEDKPRTVCSGLVKHVSMEELQNRMVMLLCNLKPVKMRGITSEAMVMCASSAEGVEVLQPPSGCSPGDHVLCEGYTRQPDTVMNPKKKIFETVAPDLHTNELLQACYKGVPFNVSGKGVVVSKSLKNVPVK